MLRYHVNPETGEPGICSARVRCRFGQPEAAHHSTPEAAREAYEKTQDSTPQSYSRATLPPPPDLSSAAILAQLQAEGKIPSEPAPQSTPSPVESSASTSVSPEEEKLANKRALKKVANELEETLAAGPEALKNHPQFQAIGSGVHRTAYLHKDSGLVYKVAGQENRRLMNKVAREEEASYQKLPLEEMKEQGITYAPTTFLKSKGGTPMVVQAYQDPVYVVSAEDHITDEQFDYLDRLASNPEETGFADFIYDNVRYDTRTKQIVAIDCLYSETAMEKL